MWTPEPLSLRTLHIDDDDQDMVDHDDARVNRGFKKLQTYAKSLPYSIESNSKMQSLLDFYLMRFVQVSLTLT